MLDSSVCFLSIIQTVQLSSINRLLVNLERGTQMFVCKFNVILIYKPID